MISGTRVQNEVAVASLTGSLDVAVQKELKVALEKSADEAGGDLVLDFAGVTFIDSSCLGAVVSLAKTLRESKGDVKIACMTDEVRSIFQITRLEKLFKIFDTVDQAVESFYS